MTDDVAGIGWVDVGGRFAFHPIGRDVVTVQVFHDELLERADGDAFLLANRQRVDKRQAELLRFDLERVAWLRGDAGGEGQCRSPKGMHVNVSRPAELAILEMVR